MRAPYDLDADERMAAAHEAHAFAEKIGLRPIPHGHGTYYEKRPGLGVTILGADVDCSKEPHEMRLRYVSHAWRTVGEERFGDSIKTTIPRTP